MKKSKTLLVLLILIAMSLLAAITLTGCGDPEYDVKYEVTGPNTVADYVIYFNSSGALDTIDNVTIPWSYTMTVSGKNIGVGCGFTIYHSTNTYTAKVYVNGKEVKSSSGTNHGNATHVIP
jgi:uncharacterized lipoprotein YehR (DUF1307 family)